MTPAADVLISHCKDIEQSIRKKNALPDPLPDRTLDEIKKGCHFSSKNLAELKKTVDTTKELLEKEIRKFSRSPAAQDRVAFLYHLLEQTYSLHIAFHSDDVKSIEMALERTRKNVPRLLKSAKQRYQKEKKNLHFKASLGKGLRMFTIVLAAISFYLAFQYPDYVSFLIPFPLFCFIFVIPALNLWLHVIEQRHSQAKTQADPTLANQVMTFLDRPTAAADLFIMLDSPSIDPQYHRQYLDMLIDLGAAYGWFENKKGRFAAKKAAFHEAANEAYAFSATTYTEEFLNEWRKTFEELQKEVKDHFGHNLARFLKKTAQNPAYFLACFRRFLQSTTAAKLKSFLSQL